MRAILALIRPERRVLAIATAVGLLATAAGLAEPLAAKAVIEALSDDRSLLTPVLILAGLTVFAAVVSAVYIWLLGRSAERIVLGVRVGLGARLLRLRVPDLDRYRAGDLVARMTSDTTLLRSAVSEGVVECVTGTVSLVGALVLMGVLEPLLLAVTLVVLACSTALILVVLPRIREASQRAQAGVGDVGSALERAFGAIRTVKASGAEPREEARISAAAHEAYRHGLRGVRYDAAIWAGIGLTIDVSFLAVLGVGGALAAEGEMSVATLVAFLLYLFSLTYPLMSLGNGASVLSQGLGALSRIDELNALERERVEPAAIAQAPRAGRRPAADDLLRGRDLPLPGRASPGDRRALAGASSRRPDRHRRTVGCRQDHALLAARALLRATGRSDPAVRRAADRDSLERAAGSPRVRRAAGADPARDAAREHHLRASRGDGGGDSRGARGGSPRRARGGPAGRTRRGPRRPQVLLLDEITSQLDARNELALRGAVERAARRCTVLVVAHRLSTVAAADRILVLEQGRVRALGTHDELMSSDELYRDLS